MRIPRKQIYDAIFLIKNLEKIKNIHYRDIYSSIDHTNFQTATKTDFKRVKIEKNVHCTWNKLINSLNESILFQYKSKSGSKYIVLNNGDIYRLSNHWGAVSSCEWTLEGEGELRCSVFVTGNWEIGVSNLNNFIVFRRKIPARKEIIINPVWKETIAPLIPLRDKLYKLKNKYIFDFMPVEDKKLIGCSYSKISKELCNL